MRVLTQETGVISFRGWRCTTSVLMFITRTIILLQTIPIEVYSGHHYELQHPCILSSPVEKRYEVSKMFDCKKLTKYYSRV